MKVAAAFLILVGILWLLGCWWLDASMRGIAEATPAPHFYWRLAATLVVPILLIGGPLLLVRRSWQRIAAVLETLGCCILTVYALLFILDIALHENASNRPFGFAIAGVFLVVTLLTDVAGLYICHVSFRRVI